MENFEALWAYQTEDMKADAIANAIRRSPVRQKLEKTRDLILDRQKQYKQIEVEITAMSDRKDVIAEAVEHSEAQGLEHADAAVVGGAAADAHDEVKSPGLSRKPPHTKSFRRSSVWKRPTPRKLLIS